MNKSDGVEGGKWERRGKGKREIEFIKYKLHTIVLYLQKTIVSYCYLSAVCLLLKSADVV